MRDGRRPNPDAIHPIPGYENEIYVRPTLQNPNIIVGDFTYIADSEFESHVTHLYPWNGDRLVIGKFCQIASGVEFVMNGANHQMSSVSTFPFYTLEGWSMDPPALDDLPIKGDTVVGNDVWIGQNAVILPGVHIGDGAIVGANSVVGSDVAPYIVVAGNPARMLRRRFDDELTALLLKWKWWDKPVDEIDALIPLLTVGDPERVRTYLKDALNEAGGRRKAEPQQENMYLERLKEIANRLMVADMPSDTLNIMSSLVELAKEMSAGHPTRDECELLDHLCAQFDGDN